LGTKYLVVLCAGSALLLVEDESTSVVNGALVGVLLGQSVSPSVVCLLLSRSIYLGFLIEGKTLLIYSSHLPLGVPNGLVIYQASSSFSGAVAREEVEDFCEGSFRTHILYFVICFALLYLFLLASFYQKPKKKLESLVVVISLL
jgi:hypothetical protein